MKKQISESARIEIAKKGAMPFTPSKFQNLPIAQELRYKKRSFNAGDEITKTNDVWGFTSRLARWLNVASALKLPLAIKQFEIFPKGELFEVKQNHKNIGLISYESVLCRILQNSPELTESAD